jgi:hypothetical protein
LRRPARAGERRPPLAIVRESQMAIVRKSEPSLPRIYDTTLDLLLDCREVSADAHCRWIAGPHSRRDRTCGTERNRAKETHMVIVGLFLLVFPFLSSLACASIIFALIEGARLRVTLAATARTRRAQGRRARDARGLSSRARHFSFGRGDPRAGPHARAFHHERPIADQRGLCSVPRGRNGATGTVPQTLIAYRCEGVRSRSRLASRRRAPDAGGNEAGSRHLGRAAKQTECRRLHAPQAPGNSHCATMYSGGENGRLMP